MITVRTDIEYGNACCTYTVEEGGVPEVHFAADPHGGTERLWFCFRIEAQERDQPVRLVLDHAQGMLGVRRDSASGIRPVVRGDQGAWQRLPGGETREHPDGRVSFVWDMAVPGSAATVALCFPHGPSDIEQLVADSKGALLSDTVGVSQKGRPIVRLANDYGQPEGDRPGIYCLSHQHASEMSGAWVCQGFLRRMAELGDAAPLVWSIPVTNVDGVMEGDYGKDPFPWDLNRAWAGMPMRHEVQEILRDIGLWRSRCVPKLAIDFHSPGGSEDRGVFTFMQSDAAWYNRQEPWIDAIHEALGDYASPEFKLIPNYPGRFDSSGKFTSSFCRRFNIPAVVFETPHCRIRDRVLALDDYLDIGSRIADGVVTALSCQKGKDNS